MKKELKIMVGIVGILIILSIFCLVSGKKEQKEVARIDSANTIEITGMELDTSVTIEKETAKEIVNLLERLNYKEQLCNGISKYTVKLPDGMVYYIKSDCKAVVKDGKQATIAEETLNKLETIIETNIHVSKEQEVKVQKDFAIKFYDKKPEGIEKIQIILDKTETEQYDYSIYAYDGNVNVRIDKEEIPLREALLQNKITMQEIIDKAEKDIPNAKLYKDGGSIEYHYDNYTILKVNKLDGNKDIYIGTKNMTLNDLSI